VLVGGISSTAYCNGARLVALCVYYLFVARFPFHTPSRVLLQVSRCRAPLACEGRATARHEQITLAPAADRLDREPSRPRSNGLSVAPSVPHAAGSGWTRPRSPIKRSISMSRSFLRFGKYCQSNRGVFVTHILIHISCFSTHTSLSLSFTMLRCLHFFLREGHMEERSMKLSG
jgi:hypothetical protein